MTFVRCIKLVIACVSVSLWVNISITTVASDSWTKSEFPNPQLDIDDCGNNGSKSWVCDPARLLTREEVEALNEQILQLRSNELCHESGQGWVASIAVVPRICLSDGKYPSSYDEELEAAQECADYLRKTSWKFGDCDNDLVIVVSSTDRKVWTSTSKGVQKRLTDECVDEIYKEAKHYFKEQNYAKGLSILLKQYRRLQTGDRECEAGGVSLIYIVAGGVIGCIAVIGVCLWCGKTGGCQGGGRHFGGGHGGGHGGGGGGDGGGGGGGGGDGGGGGGGF